MDVRKSSMVESLLKEIFAAIGDGPVPEPITPKLAVAEVRSLEKLNYGHGLRKHLDRRVVAEIISVAREKAWPLLNCRSGDLVSPKEFIRRWAGLGVDFRLADWTWPEGLALVGVYVGKVKGLLERPLICINTAHHPAMVGVAFSHELGHHLVSEIFASHAEPAAPLLRYTSYATHLDDPAELAADMLVSLRIFPQKAARRIFERNEKGRRGGCNRGENSAFTEALDYVARRYGLNFRSKFSIERKFQCLAGLLHYTKLRQALLDEYSI